MEQSVQSESTKNSSSKEKEPTLNGSGKKTKKPKKTEFYYQLQHVMNGFNLAKWPDFDKKFHVLCDERGVKTIIEELSNKVCRHVTEDAVIDAITKYCYKYLPHNPDAQVSYEEARACFRLWRSLTPNFEAEIVPVAQKSEDVLCWHRLDFDFEEGPTPTFDEMFSRASNAEAIKTWIGSLFSADADRQQYVWIYGQGNNGKGALVRFLHTIMGPAFCAQQPPTEGDRFWTSGILGKRLVVFPDCNDFNWPRTGLFKMITGNDAVKIEEKGKQPYTATLCAKLMHLSNEAPNISGSTADVRRVVYSEFQPIDTKPIADKVYQQKLLNEGAAFLKQCVDLYLQHCPDHDKIPVDIQGIEEIIEANEERFWYLFMQNFTPTKSEPGLLREKSFIPPQRFQDIFKEEKIDFKKQRSFFEYIERNFGVKRAKVKFEDGKTLRRYVGAREKTPQEREQFKVEQGAEASKY